MATTTSQNTEASYVTLNCCAGIAEFIAELCDTEMILLAINTHDGEEARVNMARIEPHRGGVIVLGRVFAGQDGTWATHVFTPEGGQLPGMEGCAVTLPPCRNLSRQRKLAGQINEFLGREILKISDEEPQKPEEQGKKKSPAAAIQPKGPKTVDAAVKGRSQAPKKEPGKNQGGAVRTSLVRSINSQLAGHGLKLLFDLDGNPVVVKA